MKINRKKLLVIFAILLMLIGSVMVFTTPNKLASRVYLSILKPHFEAISIYLSEHQEVSSIYYASPSSVHGTSSSFMLTMDNGEVRYSTGEQVTDDSINKVISSYIFSTIQAGGNNVFFCLNRYSTHFSDTLYGIQYAPLDNPIAFSDAPIKNEQLQKNWYFFVEQDKILG
ncbi:MAG: hypothetical protein RR063_11565 [Anaerovoracaceae bacterium]